MTRRCPQKSPKIADAHPRAGSKTTISYQSFPPFWQSSHRVVNKVWPAAFSITFMLWLIYTPPLPFRRSPSPDARRSGVRRANYNEPPSFVPPLPPTQYRTHLSTFTLGSPLFLSRGNFRYPSSFTSSPDVVLPYLLLQCPVYT